MYLSIHSLCSSLCWSAYGSSYSLKSLCVWCYKLGTSIFSQLLPFFSPQPLKLHLVGCISTQPVHSSSLKDIHTVVQKPLLCYLVVLLEDEPSTQSVFRAFWSTLSLTMSELFFVHLSQFLLTKNIHTTMLQCRDVIGQVMSGTWFLLDMALSIQAKNFCFIRPDNYFLRVWESSRCLLANSRLGVMCLLLTGYCLATI